MATFRSSCRLSFQLALTALVLSSCLRHGQPARTATKQIERWTLGCSPDSCAGDEECVLEESACIKHPCPLWPQCRPKTERRCGNVECPFGEYCMRYPVDCRERNCDYAFTCVRDPTLRPSCGDVMDKPCPGLGLCMDDTTDLCDPKVLGKRCPGVCRCTQQALCTPGYVFDMTPEICACVKQDTNACSFAPCPSGTSCTQDGAKLICD